MPIPGPTAGEVSAALDGQTARLDQANGRTADVVAIVDVCDRHNADAATQARALEKPKFLGLF